MELKKRMGVESINARIKKAKHHMPCLRGDNFVPYLRVRFAPLIFKDSFQAKYNRAEKGGEDLQQFHRDDIVCQCPICQEILQPARDALSREEQHESDAPQFFLEGLRVRMRTMHKKQADEEQGTDKEEENERRKRKRRRFSFADDDTEGNSLLDECSSKERTDRRSWGRSQHHISIQ